MIRNIARYGVRNVPGTTGKIFRTLFSGTAVKGPYIAEFEKKFAAYHGLPHAISASYGRMAFYYILKAMNFPSGSEIIFPALTFWVIPEIARVAGLRPVFVDIDRQTFNLNPELIEPSITSSSAAIVPTHLYGQSCDMDRIIEIARRYNLRVIEDCAHSLGASYKGRKVGTFGDAAFFSFQMLKPLNTFGGGMAILSDDDLAKQIRDFAEAELWPSVNDIREKFIFGHVQRGLISPYGFTFSIFLAFYVASFFGNHDLSRYLWEKIRPLDPLPESYKRRYSNVQALMGLMMLNHIDKFNAKCRRNADQLTEGLQEIDSIVTPATLAGASPVYYQYCIRVSDPETLSHRAIRKGIDIEIMHVDICNKLELFAPYASQCPEAESTGRTLQLPVYSSLKPSDVERILRVVREASRGLTALPSVRLERMSTWKNKPTRYKHEQDTSGVDKSKRNGLCNDASN